NIGIGFAVPSNMVRAVMQQLMKYGEMRRGRIGLTTQDITPEETKRLGTQAIHAAVVVEVAKNSPADKAGLRPRDTIIALNGRAVRGSADLRNQIGLVPVGEEVEFRFLRDGELRSVKARLEPVQTTEAIGGESISELSGATVADAERNGRPEAVAVVEVVRDSPAWARGLRPGDLIVAVNRQKVRTVRELTAAFQVQGHLVLTVVRGDYVFTVLLRR
ncbi:MAG TPA: PDZ domain-containing protein, partial [Burkholderiales bacterium]|nr:PDZ domain-containing protein [Burkholderiales bacterium]